MKITLEQAALPETEVILRGDITGPEITRLLALLKGSRSTGRILVSREEEQFLLESGEIVYAETAAGKVLVYTAAECYETRLKLYELKEQLADSLFVQISKSTLVNIDHVRSVQAEFSGNYRLRLKTRPEKLTISRKYFPEFRSRIR